MSAINKVLLEECSEAAHNEWLAEKRRRGVTTWPNERGFEQMVPYAECPEDVKEFDRIVIGAIMGILNRAGLTSRLYHLYVDLKRWTDDGHPEPWGATISAIVRSTSPEAAATLIADDFRAIPHEYWIIESLEPDGPETLITSSEYGNA